MVADPASAGVQVVVAAAGSDTAAAGTRAAISAATKAAVGVDGAEAAALAPVAVAASLAPLAVAAFRAPGAVDPATAGVPVLGVAAAAGDGDAVASHQVRHDPTQTRTSTNRRSSTARHPSWSQC